MTVSGCKIGVVGAGIGGLASAIALAQRGARVCIFEQAMAISDIGAGIQISPNGVAVLRSLGFNPEKFDLAVRPAAVELRDYRAGKFVARLPLNRNEESLYLQFHRTDLLEWLLVQAGQYDIEIKLGQKIQALEPSTRGFTLADGQITPDAYDCVIAADGIRSGIRRSIFSHHDPRFTGQIAWRAIIPGDQLTGHPLTMGTTIVMGPGRHIVTYPLRGGREINLVAIEERYDWVAEGWHQADDPQNLRDAFTGWFPDITSLLAKVETVKIWGLFDHPVLPKWNNGWVALLGDAAHPMVPFLGQGANMALEDAWVLAHALDQSRDIQTGLANYEKRRKLRATRAQNASVGNGKIYHMKNPLLRQILHFGLRTTSATIPAVLSYRYNWLHGMDVTKDG